MFVDIHRPPPGIAKFREIKAREKERAIARKEIMTANPNLTTQQADAIIEGRKKAQQTKKRIKKQKQPKKPEVIVLPNIKTG